MSALVMWKNVSFIRMPMKDFIMKLMKKTVMVSDYNVDSMPGGMILANMSMPTKKPMDISKIDASYPPKKYSTGSGMPK